MNSATHLSEDHIDDLLIGDLADEPAAHLASCNSCQSRVAAAEAPFASFKAVTLSWSERRSATLPAVTQTSASSWHRHARWASVATAVLLVGIAVPMAKHEAHSATGLIAHPASESASSPTLSPFTAETAQAAEPQQATLRTAALPRRSQEEQIARDNQMLQAIDQELDASVQSPVDTFGVVTAGSRSPIHARNAPVQTWD